MAIIDRDTLAPESRQEPTVVDRHRGAPTEPPSPQRVDPVWSVPGRVLVASAMAGAGVIHLVMVPAHAGEWLPEGIAFAVAGWLQVAMAAAIMARPSRRTFAVACAVNAVFIAAWVTSRVWGLPVGPEAGVPHEASFIDISCVVLEAVALAAGLALLARPGLGARLSSAALVGLSIVPLSAFVLTTAAIASPSAQGHGHDSAASGAGGDGHDHGTTGADGHDGAPVDDLGLSLIMNGAGEGGGHVHDGSVAELNPTTQALLDAQLAKMQPLIDTYPTVADAEAAGYTRQGPYSPALGAHYGESGAGGGVNLGPTVSDEDLLHPMLIFDGVAPESKLAGFMYNIFSTDTENPPEGFVGPNDHWHYHTDVCIKPRPGGGTDAPLGADQSTSKELCDTYGGFLIANTGYMVHVWPVPGYESPQGLFSNLNPKLACPNGTYYTVPQDQLGSRSNACLDVPA